MLPASLISLIVGYAVIALPTVSAVVTSARSQKYRQYTQIHYEDQDGASDESTQRDFLATKLPTRALIASAFASFSLSFALALLNTISQDGQSVRDAWLLFGLHALTGLQILNAVLLKDPVQRFANAVYSACSCLAILIVMGVLRNVWLQPTSRGLFIADAATVAAAAICGLLLPRRPNLFFEGKPVDRQMTVPFLSRLTFTFVTPLLALASKNRQLRIEDLPWIGHYGRSDDLLSKQNRLEPGQSLLALLLRAHGKFLAFQWLLTAIQACAIQTPQLALYKLLRALEKNREGGHSTESVTLWVVMLGIFIMAIQFADCWMWFISYAYMQVPVRVHLSAMVYTKALRRRDIKGVAETEINPDAEEDTETNNTQQGTVNLVGIDAKRVCLMASFNNWFLGAAMKLVISFTFLGYLIGWKALLAGAAVQLASMPLNIYFSKRYTVAQNRIMKIRDQKLAVINEVLKGIRHIKFAAFEDRTEERIRKVRELELSAQWSAFMNDVGLAFCWLVGPIMLSAVSLGVYAWLEGTLSSSVAFTTMGILTSIQVTLAVLPELTSDLLDCWVSIKRLEKYLSSPDKPDNTKPGENVKFSRASFAWPSEEEEEQREFVIRDAEIEFPKHELSVISGRTGSGKSLLLAAILGEADVLSGDIYAPRAGVEDFRADNLLTKDNWIIPGALSYVSQQPWIENATFKDNILFGLPFDQSRYEEVVDACALTQDRKILSDGDETEIGANGINLSGGQKWRITLARALYSRAGTLVMDDIFSAVDAHVGRHIFDHAIGGSLGKGRTKILATHHVSLVLPAAKYLVHLENGKVEYVGTKVQLKKDGKIDVILKVEKEEEAEAAAENTEVTEPTAEQPVVAIEEQDNDGTHMLHKTTTYQSIVSETDGKPRNRRQSTASKRSNAENESRQTAAPKKFVEEETKETGRVAWTVYKKYMSAFGSIWFWLALVVVFTLFQGTGIARSWWITLWTRSYQTEAKTTAHHFHPDLQLFLTHPGNDSVKAEKLDSNTAYYLGVYVGASLFMTFLGTFRALLAYHGSISGSRKLFNDLTYAVLRAPLRWLDTMPVGRLLNRFTTDFSTIDSELAFCAANVIDEILAVIGIIATGVVVSPWVILFALTLLLVSSYYAVYYIDATREMKRLESVARSPIYEVFGTTLSGVATIRTFGKTNDYIKKMFGILDAHGSTLYYMWTMNRWVTIRLGAIGAVFAVVMAGFVSSVPGFDPALAGFALSFSLQYTDTIFWLLRQFANVEMAMNSAERILEYSEIAIEDQGGKQPPAAWPTEGRIEVEKLVVKYADDLAPVLRGISFDVKPKERCAVVGRTGAGKSSLTLAFFRFLRAHEGSITIDGHDISTLRLHDLRSRLAIIPQDPVLFSGTVRTNLDPFDEHTDIELFETLKRVHLLPALFSPTASTDITPPPTAVASLPASTAGTNTATNANPFTSLRTPIAESGTNLSQGQRQLLCLARAILSRPKILILDEATSAVDKATDTLIQRSIREQFKDTTLIVIAHRLSTIADFDRVLVLGEGKVLEYDTPRALLEKDGEGGFRGMVEESGEREVVRGVILGDG